MNKDSTNMEMSFDMQMCLNIYSLRTYRMFSTTEAAASVQIYSPYMDTIA